MVDFYSKFKQVYPLLIKDWQTDNGGENLGEFEDQLIQDKIPHFFSYPRCPKINAVIERFNRTFQEDFVDQNLDVIRDKPEFNRRLSTPGRPFKFFKIFAFFFETKSILILSCSSRQFRRRGGWGRRAGASEAS